MGEIADVCREFERAWKAEQRPQIEEYLRRVPPPNDKLLQQELIRLESRLRAEHDRETGTAEYRSRVPDDSTGVQALESHIDSTGELELNHDSAFSLVTSADAKLREVEQNPPECLGGYRLIREIGRGGMGIVYEGRDIKLNKRVAIKVLPVAGMLNRAARVRFQNEAKAAAQLEHPHIVPVYGFGMEGGTHFYTMQFIEGVNLARLIADIRRLVRRAEKNTSKRAPPAKPSDRGGDSRRFGNVSDTSKELLDAVSTRGTTSDPSYLEAFARVGIEVSDALQHAHDRGIVHRDIKPSNLLMDTRGHMWVADFGLAQIQGDVALTAPGDVVGTLRYMSPEQAYAKRLIVDHRTDLFSLGATLYELLTLRQAFDGESRGEILRQIAFEDPPSPHRLDRRLPVELDTIVMKAIAKNPDERYQSAGELAADLRAWQRDEPIRARRPTLSERTRKWARKHRPLVASSAFAAVAVTLAALLSLAAMVQAEKQVRAATESRNQELAEALTVSEGRRLVTQAALELPENPGRAIALAAAGTRLHQSAEANTVLLQALDRDHEYRVLTQPTGSVGCVRYSPDATRIVTTGSSQASLADREPARLFDAQTGSLLAVLSDEETITSAAFSSTGRRLLTATTPSTAGALSAEQLAEHEPSVWDVESGRLIGTLAGAFLMEAHPAAFALNDAQTLIVAPAVDNTARIYNVAGDQVRVLRGHESRVTYAGFSRDGSQIVTVGDDNTVRLWDAGSGQQVRVLDMWRQRLPNSRVPLIQSVQFNSDSSQLLTSSVFLGVHLWDLRDEEPLEPRDCGRGAFATFSPDGAQIATFYGRKVTVLDSDNQVVICEFTEPNRDVDQLVFSPDSRYLVTRTTSPYFRAWDSVTGEAVAEFRGHEAVVEFVTFHPDGLRLVSGSRDRTARIWSLQSGAERMTYPTAVNTHYPLVAYDRDGQRLAVATETDYHVTGWNPETGAQLFTVPGRASDAAANGSHFATYSDHEVTVHSLESGAAVARLDRRLGTVDDAAISPRGDQVLIRASGGQTCLWPWQTGDLTSLAVGAEQATASAFHPQRPQVAIASDDGFLRLWDSQTGEQIADSAIDGEGTLLAFSPDGKDLLLVQDGRAAQLLDASSLAPRVQLQHRGHRLHRAFFTSDSRFLITYQVLGGEILAWDTSNGQVVGETDNPGGRTRVIAAEVATQVWIASDEQGVFLWDFSTGDLNRRSSTPATAVGLLNSGPLVVASAPPQSLFVHMLGQPQSQFRPSALELRDASSGELLRQVGAPHRSVRQILPSPNENVMLSGDRSYRIAIFETKTRRRITAMVGHAAPLSFVRFTPDDEHLVSCGWDGQAMVWDAKTGELERRIVADDSPIVTAALSFDGKWLAAGARDGSVTVWELASGEVVQELKGLSSPVVRISFAAFAARLAALAEDGQWHVWQTSTGESVRIEPDEPTVRAIEFQPDGSRLLVVRDAEKPEQQAIVQIISRDGRVIALPHDKTPMLAAFGPRGRRVVTIAADRAAVWDAGSGQRLFMLPNTDPTIRFATFAPAGEQLLLHRGSMLTVIDRGGDEVLSLNDRVGYPLPRLPQQIEYFSPDGSEFVTLLPDARLRSVPLQPLEHVGTEPPRHFRESERARYHYHLPAGDSAPTP